MRLVILRSLAVLTVGAVALVGVLYIASTVDARSPEVVGFELTQSLADHPETALITTSLEIAFNEPILLDSDAEPIALAPRVEGTVSWSGSTLIFTPRDPLELETEYVATLGTGIRDAAGNRIANPPPSFAFTTAGRPAVLEALPEDGATGVAVDGEIRIEFSTLMDTASVDAELTIEPAVAHELRWSGEVLEIAPLAALAPDRDYVVRIGGEAADVAGVQLGEPFAIGFRTVAPGLEPVTVLPADGVDGIAPNAPLAVIFDRGIDPDSVSNDLFRVTPEVAGSLQVVTTSGDPPDEEPYTGRVLRFAPSGPLPLNTTFEVVLEPGLRAVDGGLMAEPLTWTFTTGAPAATLSNQITFITDLGGVANVWAMNPDGSGQHQVSTELTPVLEYAVAPDGSRIVVADGRRLISALADGSGRTVLTDEDHVEFDPAFAPNGQRLAFGRADAATGEGLGLWLSAVDGGNAQPVVLPEELGASPTPSTGVDAPPESGWLRAPAFSPDGQALAFVDALGAVAILELPSERLTRAETGAGAPVWLPDSSGILFTRGQFSSGGPPDSPEPVRPLAPPAADRTTVALLSRSGTALDETQLRGGVALAGVDRTGRIAHLDADGGLFVSDGPADRGARVPGTADIAVIGSAFATGQDAMVIVVADGEPTFGEDGRLELLDLETGERTDLATRGARPRWLP